MSDLEGEPGSAPPSIDELAGEYVLGLLPDAQRHEVEERARHDDGLAQAIGFWEDRLSTIADRVTPIESSPLLWERIERSLAPAPVTNAASVRGDWWNSLAFWRTTSFVTVAFAAAFAIALFKPPARHDRLVAVLQSPQSQAGWIVEIDAADHLNLSPLVSTDVPEGRVLQFWTKAPTATGPTSLGLVPADRDTGVALDRLAPVVADQLFELTLEPTGGSTIGRPTGPILFVGRAVARR